LEKNIFESQEISYIEIISLRKKQQHAGYEQYI